MRGYWDLRVAVESQRESGVIELVRRLGFGREGVEEVALRVEWRLSGLGRGGVDGHRLVRGQSSGRLMSRDVKGICWHEPILSLIRKEVVLPLSAHELRALLYVLDVLCAFSSLMDGIMGLQRGGLGWGVAGDPGGRVRDRLHDLF